MEQQFGEASWDIYACHKGDWCLYKSQLCQIKTGCVNCGIYIEVNEKFNILMAKSFKEVAK